MGANLPQPGDVIAGKYRLERLLGEGGFARVFEATDLTLGRPVAIKLLKPTGGADEVRGTQRFLREMKVIAALSHPNIVTMFDYGRTEAGLWFMVFERVGGDDLADILAAGALTEAETVHVLVQLLGALGAAHDQGVLHRDIKPENIRIYAYQDDPLRAKLLDFGIATHVDGDDARLTSTGKVVGTPRFMAPEQLRGQPLTPAADLYSVGLVAYEMLARRPSENVQQVARGGRVLLAEDVPVSETVRRVVNRMLEPSPAARFQSAAEVLARLGQAAPGASPVGGPAEPPIAAARAARAPSPPNARRTHHVGIATLAVIATVAIGAAIFAKREAASPAAPSAVRRTNPLLAPGSGAGPPAIPSEPAPTDDPDLAADGCGVSPARTGLTRLRKVEGLEARETDAYIPSIYAPDKRLPLVVLLHDSAQTGGSFLRDSRFIPVAERAGFVIIAPTDAQDPTDAWIDPNRLEIVERAIHHAQQELCIDPRRVFLVGYHAGARAVERARDELPQLAGVATFGYRVRKYGGLPEQDHPLPHIHLAPLRDGYRPVAGSAGCDGVRYHDLDTHEEWSRGRNACAAVEKRRFERTGGVCVEWECETPFMSCRLDGGRNWDGLAPRTFDIHGCDGPVNTFPSAEAIWAFFAEVADAPRPPAAAD